MTSISTAIAVTIFAPEDLRVVERPLGDLAEGMVRIAFGAGGICGSDMHYFKHARTGDFAVTSPMVLGHEIAGTIAAINAKASGKAPGLKVGDRIAVNPSRWCGECSQCKRGKLNLCERIYFMGSASKTPHMQGGFASYFDAIPAQCIKIPDHVSFKAAALGEPLAVCLHAVKRAGPIKGMRGLVIGAGPIGLLTMLAARKAGLEYVSVADIAPAPLAFARRLGATAVIDLAADPEALANLGKTAPFDIIFEASGAPPGVASAIAAAWRGGIIVQIGNLPGGAIPVPANAIMSKELDFRGTFRFDVEFDEAVRMIAAGEIDVTSIITAERPLSEAPAALRLALDRTQSMKVMLVADAT
ncbi:MAG: L-idonate 5-dehydrogenase [Beijerinckiaceae bacterium]